MNIEKRKKVKPISQLGTVTEVIVETKDTKSLHLELENLFDFQPGQFAMVDAIINGVNVRRAYSIASSPTRRQYLQLTVRQTETPTMSKYLNDRVVGDNISIRGPYGKFIWNENVSDELVMLAGGSGITPFKAMIEYVIDKNLDTKLLLLYSTRYADNVIFGSLLPNLVNQTKNGKMELSLTREKSDDYHGRRGRIDTNYLREKIKDFEDPYFYLCGNPGFINGMKSNLAELNIDASRIKREQWG